jgi:hypothetical protein
MGDIDRLGILSNEGCLFDIFIFQIACFDNFTESVKDLSYEGTIFNCSNEMILIKQLMFILCILCKK